MTRRYTPGSTASGAPRLTPSPTPQGPRAGIQVVQARAPRTGPSAAEEIDGVIPPIDLRAELGPVLGDPQRPGGYDSTLSNGTGQHVVKPSDRPVSCQFCDATDETDIVLPCQDGDPRSICGRCVERLVDALRAELPRRRLRLAMERLAAGTVSIETVEAVERLAAKQTAPEKTDV